MDVEHQFALNSFVKVPYVYRFRMEGWYDGDSPTISVDLGFGTWQTGMKLRLYGVDTPELRGEEREKGLYVRDIVREWIPPETEGLLRTHKDQTGKFGRYLAELKLENWNMSINQRLLVEGLAEIEAYTKKEHQKVRQLFGPALYDVIMGDDNPLNAPV